MDSNFQHPYEVTKEGDWNYSFQTKHGITYHVYFLDYSVYHPDFLNVYMFNIEPETDTPHPIDSQIALTIVGILRQFFLHRKNAMIMICDTLDGKETKRELLFSRWFLKYNDGSLVKYDASSESGDYTLYISLYLRKDNVDAKQLVNAFYDLVKNNLYPIE